MSSINNSENYGINRGVELILRKKGGEKQPEFETNEFGFGKVFSFLRWEIHFKIELKVTKK